MIAKYWRKFKNLVALEADKWLKEAERVERVTGNKDFFKQFKIFLTKLKNKGASNYEQND